MTGGRSDTSNEHMQCSLSLGAYSDRLLTAASVRQLQKELIRSKPQIQSMVSFLTQWKIAVRNHGSGLPNTGESPAKAAKMMWELEQLSEEERPRHLGSWKTKRSSQ